MRQWSEHSTPINLTWVQVLLCTPYITLGVGRGILGGITSFLGEQNGGSVVTENPKAGMAENFGRIQRGDHSNLLGK